MGNTAHGVLRVFLSATTLVFLVPSESAGETGRPGAARQEAHAEERDEEPAVASEGEEGSPSEADEARLVELENNVDRVHGDVQDIRDHVGSNQDELGALRQRLETQEARIAELEAQLQDDAEPSSAAEENPRLQWTRAGGVVWRPTNSDNFVLGLRGFLWARWDGSFSDVPTLVPDSSTTSGERIDTVRTYLSSFNIPETRIRFMATFLDGRIHVAIQPSLIYGRAGIQDGYVEFRLHPAATIRVGQMLVPYDWESNTSPPMLPLNGLGPLAGEFGHGRDLGVMLMGTAAERVHYRIGVFNGSGRGTANPNHHMLTAAMLRVQALGTTNAGWGWSDLERSERPNLAFRLGFSYERENMTVEDASRPNYTLSTIEATADVLFRWRGVSLAFAYYYRTRLDENFEDRNLVDDPLLFPWDEWYHSHGFLVHAGYMVWAEHLELLVRYTSLDTDMDSDGDMRHFLDAGLTGFIVGHQARITLLYRLALGLPDEAGTTEALSHGLQIEARVWF